MAAEARLHVSVISPEATIFEGQARQVIAPAWDGQLGVLAGHAPMIVLLGAGELRIDGAGGSQRYQVSGGFMQVVDDRVTILSESAGTGSGARGSRPAAADTDQAANPLA